MGGNKYYGSEVVKLWVKNVCFSDFRNGKRPVFSMPKNFLVSFGKFIAWSKQQRITDHTT